MTTGVYALKWSNKEGAVVGVYVGSSHNVEQRIRTHRRKTKAGEHENYLVQWCYQKYGEPEIVVVETFKNIVSAYWLRTREYQIIQAARKKYGSRLLNLKDEPALGEADAPKPLVTGVEGAVLSVVSSLSGWVAIGEIFTLLPNLPRPQVREALEILAAKNKITARESNGAPHYKRR